MGWIFMLVMLSITFGLGGWVTGLVRLFLGHKANRDAVDSLEKLARLRSEGSLTEEEYADSKRRVIAAMDPAPRDRPIPEPPDSPLGHLERLAELRDNEILTEEEFSARKGRFLHLGAEGPTADEVAGLAHIEKLAALRDNERITEEEFTAQKREILGFEPAMMAKPAGPADDLADP